MHVNSLLCVIETTSNNLKIQPDLPFLYCVKVSYTV